MDLPKTQLTGLTLKYLGKNRLMTLATSQKDQPWAVTVFYAFTDKSELIFFSDPTTTHCQMISRNPKVAVVINHHQPLGKINGIQLVGEVRMIDENEHKYYSIYEKRFPWAKNFTDHTIFVIKPKQLFYLDEEAFGHFFKVRVI